MVIIGGGLAGLSTAYHLEQQGFTNYRIFEKDSRAGGLCKSLVIDDFTFDYATHILYSGDSYAEELIKNKLLNNEFDSQIRKSFVFYRGIYTEYPFQAHLYGQDPDIIQECILGLIKATYGGASNPRNFEEWIYSTFGSGIAEHFMLPYNRKQWAIDLSRMSYDWVAKRVPIPKIEDVLEGALKPPQRKYGPNAYFWYPLRGGMGALPDGFLPYIRNISLNSEISKISLPAKEVEVKGERLKYDKLVSTIPLPQTISLIADDVPTEVKQAAESLEYNAVYAINLAVDRPNISSYHWVYFPETKSIFHRIGFPMNLSPFMAPEGRSSITAEISVSKHKPLKMGQDEIIEAVIAGLLECGVIKKGDGILFRDFRRLDPAYVTYTPNRRENVELVHSFLNSNDIYPCGRFGDWEYSNMDQSILSGQKVAQAVTKNMT